MKEKQAELAKGKKKKKFKSYTSHNEPPKGLPQDLESAPRLIHGSNIRGVGLSSAPHKKKIVKRHRKLIIHSFEKSKSKDGVCELIATKAYGNDGLCVIGKSLDAMLKIQSK